MTDQRQPQTPLDLVAPMAVDEGMNPDGSRHVELYCPAGLLTLHWAGDPAAENVVICMGGAMGGVLGPAKALFHEFATALPAEGVGVMRVGYRRPNDAEMCLIDVAAAAESAGKVGAKRFVFMGHSFGGAVAIQAALALGTNTAGVAVFATQSAGCEGAEYLGGLPFVLYHGDADRILPFQSSQMVQMLAGYGDVHILAGADHLLIEAADDIRAHVYPWIRESFAAHVGQAT